MKFVHKAILLGGTATAATAGGMYLGIRETADRNPGERLVSGGVTAALGGATVIGGYGLHRQGAFKAAAKSGFHALRRATFTRTSAYVGGGAALGAALGAVSGGYSYEDPTKGAEIGALVGAGAGGVLRLRSPMKAAAKELTPVHRLGLKSAVAATAVLGGLVAAAGVHSRSDQPTEVSYGFNGDDGEFGYSDTPIHHRMVAMKASGDIVLGLHRKRKG